MNRVRWWLASIILGKREWARLRDAMIREARREARLTAQDHDGFVHPWEALQSGDHARSAAESEAPDDRAEP